MIVVNYTWFSSQSECLLSQKAGLHTCTCIPRLCFRWCRLLRPSGWTDRHLLACIECRLMNVFMCNLPLFFCRLIPVHRHLVHNVPVNCYKPAGSQVLPAEVFKTHFCERKDFEKRCILYSPAVLVDWKRSSLLEIFSVVFFHHRFFPPYSSC